MADQLANIPTGQLVFSLTNPRKDEDDVSELCASILEHGIIQPIIVRKDGPTFEIICGSRRFRAARRLGLREIPCIVKDDPGCRVLEMQLVENVQRADLAVMEEARSLQTLARLNGMNHERVARKLGKTQAWVSNRIKLTELVPAVEAMLAQGTIKTDVAVSIARLRPADQHPTALRLCGEGLRNRKAIDEVRRVRHDGGERTAQPKPSVQLPKQVHEMRAILHRGRNLTDAELALIQICINGIRQLAEERAA